MILIILISFVIVAFAQSAWLGFLGPIAAAIGYALFWHSMMQVDSTKKRVSIAFCWFSLIQAFQLSWLATTHYMGPLIVAVYVFVLLGLGLQFAFFSYFVQKPQPMTYLRCAALSGLWVLLEWIRLFFCTGFTWNPAGLSLTTSLLSLQMASFFGIYGLSFWVVFVNLMAYRANLLRSRAAVGAWAICAILPYCFGALQLSFAPESEKSLSALLVQTALWPEQRDFDPKMKEKYIAPFDQWDRLITLMESARPGEVELIVLPEGGVPYDAFHCVYSFSEMKRIWIKHFGSADDLPTLGEPIGCPLSRVFSHEDGKWWVSNAFWIQAIANHYGSEVIVGMDDRDIETGEHFNAAFHFRPHVNKAFRTEKRVLVPIGEYVPLKDWPWFSQFISKEFGIGDSFDPGRDAKVFFGQIPIGVSICYEETYSELIRQLRERGAQLFVNISNDVWFPFSKLAHQHFDHGMVRAVENGLPLIRACNTGITGGVDCFGRLLGSKPEYQANVLFLKVPLQTVPTLYSVWGDWAILFLSAFFAAWIFKKHAPGPCPK